MDRLSPKPHPDPIPTEIGFSPTGQSAAAERLGGTAAQMLRPNYRFERAERDRRKRAKKEEKHRRQQERAEQQKVVEPDEGASSPSSDGA